MTNLSEYKISLVFECNYKTPNVNTLHELIVDYDANTDTKICSHCFYASKKAPILEHIDISKVKHTNKSVKSKKAIKKNKSFRNNF